MVARLRLLAAGVLAALCVLVLPSEAFAAARPASFAFTQYACGWATAGIEIITPTNGCEGSPPGTNANPITVRWLNAAGYDTSKATVLSCPSGGVPNQCAQADVDKVQITKAAGLSAHAFPTNYSFSFARIYDVWHGTPLGNEWLGRFYLNARGQSLPDPSDKETSTTCDSYRNVSVVLADGTLDLTWNWKGTVPARGWDLTDAGLTQPTGAGSIVGTVTTSDVPAGSGRYGVTAWTIPPSITSLRVQARGNLGCFIGFKLTRDASGNVTGITGGGSVTDTTPPDPATDDDGANCGLMDFVCMLKWLFVPDASSWDFSGVHDQLKTRAPFSLGAEAVAAVGTFVDEFDTDSCGNLPDFGLSEGGYAQDGSRDFNCGDGPRGLAPGYMTPLRLIFEAGLYGLTCFALWTIVRGAFNK